MSYRIDHLSITNILVAPLRHNSFAPIERFYSFSLKAIEFNFVDTNDFLRNFLVLMYLFIFIDIVILQKKSHYVRKIIDDRIVITERLFFIGFDTFLAQFFFELAVFAYFFQCLDRRKILTGLKSLLFSIQGIILGKAIIS